MSGKVYIASTLTCSQLYTSFKDVNGLPFPETKIFIAGGANLAGSDGSFGAQQGHDENGRPLPIWTPDGVVTEITDNEYALLQNNDVFKLHVENGFVRKLDKDPRAEVDGVSKVAADMTGADASAPADEKTLTKVTPTKGLTINTGPAA